MTRRSGKGNWHRKTTPSNAQSVAASTYAGSIRSAGGIRCLANKPWAGSEKMALCLPRHPPWKQDGVMNSVSPRSPIHHRVFGHRRKPRGRVRPHGQVSSFHNAANDVIFIDSPQNCLQNLSKTPASSPTLSPIRFYPSAPRREKPYLFSGRVIPCKVSVLTNTS